MSDRDDDWGVLFAGSKACASVETFRENGVEWTIQTVRSGRPGPLFVVPHDDEQTALATAAWALERYGGTLVAVETGGKRLNAGLDPNRNFRAGRSRCRSMKAEAPRYVAAVLRHRTRAPIVALHTNKPGAAGTGGGHGNLSLTALPARATAFRGVPTEPALASEDAFVIVASRRGADDARLGRTVRRLNAAGVSVIVERVDPDEADCSLSNYAALSGIANYYNVEAPVGAVATHRRMVDILFGVVDI